MFENPALESCSSDWEPIFQLSEILLAKYPFRHFFLTLCAKLGVNIIVLTATHVGRGGWLGGSSWGVSQASILSFFCIAFVWSRRLRKFPQYFLAILQGKMSASATLRNSFRNNCAEEYSNPGSRNSLLSMMVLVGPTNYPDACQTLFSSTVEMMKALRNLEDAVPKTTAQRPLFKFPGSSRRPQRGRQRTARARHAWEQKHCMLLLLCCSLSPIWLQTNGVNTHGAAAKVINFDRLGKNIRPGTLGKTKVG